MGSGDEAAVITNTGALKCLSETILMPVKNTCFHVDIKTFIFFIC